MVNNTEIIIEDLAEFLGISKEFVRERVEHDSNHATEPGLYTVPNMWKWMYGHREGNLDEHRLFYSVCFPYLFDLTNFASQFDLDKAGARKYVKGDCLDFGCGIGTVGLELADKAKNVDCIDISIVCTEFLKFRVKKHKIKNVSVLRTPYFQSTKQYDFIYVRDVFEHALDRLEILKRLVPCLKTGGVLCEASPIFEYPEEVGKENVKKMDYDVFEFLIDNNLTLITSEPTGGFSDSNTNVWLKN